jgi:hypothetical protein
MIIIDLIQFALPNKLISNALLIEKIFIANFYIACNTTPFLYTESVIVVNK